MNKEMVTEQADMDISYLNNNQDQKNIQRMKLNQHQNRSRTIVKQANSPKKHIGRVGTKTEQEPDNEEVAQL